MYNSKKIISFILIIITLLLPTIVYANDIDIQAKSAILIDADSGQILMKKNANLKLPPASITKTMTLLLAMEAIEKGKTSLDDKVKVTDLAESMGGSQIWLKSGEELPLRDLLKAISIPSANDACVAVAEHIGGTERNFIRMMNQKAKELGLKHTHFVNTTGLPVETGKHYSSAHDIAVIARELVKHSKVLDWTSKRMGYIKQGNYPIYTTNELLGNFPGADGLKTGWTEQAGYCLVGTSKQGDLRLISVIMGADSETARVEETSKLLNYGFRNFHKVRLINSNIKVTTVKVAKGEQLETPVATATSFSALVEYGLKDQVEQEVKITQELEAPIEKGKVVGQLIFMQDKEKLGEVDLVTTKKVNKAGMFTLLTRWIKSFILGFFK